MSHDPLEIILICWFAEETFLIIINVKTVMLLIIFVKIMIHLFEIEIYYNIINAFTVTIGQFNVSLQNKGCKKSYWPQAFLKK